MNKLEYNNWVTKSLLFAFAISLGAFLITLHHDGKLRDDVRNLKKELAHAAIPMKTDTIRDSIPVVVQAAKVIDRTDYKKEMADRELIDDLQLKLSQVESENRMLRQIRDQVPLKADSDSIFSYHDHWADFLVDMRLRSLDYSVRDSLVTIIARIPKHKFLWWRWGTKGYEVKIVNFNPRAEVRYNETILIGK